MEYVLTATTESPLMLHAGRGASQFTPTLDYIPGTALRGALAARHIGLRNLEHPEKDRDFRTLFLDGSVRWGDLTVGTLLPNTARACKRFGPKHRRSVGDALIYLEAVRAAGHSTPIADWEKCTEDQVCAGDNTRDRLIGYYNSDHWPTDEKDYENWDKLLVQPKQRLVTGTAIHRSTGTVRQGQLFAHHVLEEGQTFSGRVWVADRLDAHLKPLVDELLEAGPLRIGSARSRGFGQIGNLTLSPLYAAGDFDGRWDRFNQAQTMVTMSHELASKGPYFSMTLHSHVVLTAQQAAAPDPIQALLNPPDAERVRSVIRYITLVGWNERQGRPKADAIAIARGSVLLFRATDRRGNAAKAWAARIEQEGIGLRLEEGYGRVIVCDPFHAYWILHPQEKK